jgi:hypothetical protein
MKKFNYYLNIIMGSIVGTFVGMGISQCYDYHAHPDLYAMTSFPWYTSILMSGKVTLVLFAICVVIKVIIKRKMRK